MAGGREPLRHARLGAKSHSTDLKVRRIEPKNPPLLSNDRDPLREVQDFSLVLGGPLFQLLRKAHLADDAMKALRRRILTLSLAAWAPLLVLAWLEGHAWGSTVTIPFLRDPEVNTRFLVALPLLVLAEVVVHQRIRDVVQGFLARGLIAEADLGSFQKALRSALRLRNSVVAEVLLLVVVYGVGVLVIFRHYFPVDAHTWYASSEGGAHQFSRAGLWYGYVSLPLYQFLLVRWYFRLFIWSRLLWQISRLPLRLMPLHPDRLGGLRFVTNSVYAFAPLTVAHGAVIAGHLANRILYTGAHLKDFRVETFGLAAFLCCLFLGPLLVFTPALAKARREGLRMYGLLAARYVRDFEQKWLHGDGPADEPLLGSGDIQSLADLGNSFEIVKSMNLAPVTRDAILQVSFATLAPFVPLALTMMPLEELLKQLFGILF